MTIHRTHDPSSAPAPSWEERLNRARRDRDVVAIAREFLALLTPGELEALPAPCRPPLKLVDREDVAGYAFDLVKHDCEGAHAEAQLVQRMARFFFHASHRLATLSLSRKAEHEERGCD